LIDIWKADAGVAAVGFQNVFELGFCVVFELEDAFNLCGCSYGFAAVFEVNGVIFFYVIPGCDFIDIPT